MSGNSLFFFTKIIPIVFFPLFSKKCTYKFSISQNYQYVYSDVGDMHQWIWKQYIFCPKDYITVGYFVSKRLGTIQNICKLNCFCTFQWSFVSPSALSCIREAFYIPPQQQQQQQKKTWFQITNATQLWKLETIYVTVSTITADDSIKSNDY